jgi:hypothetical protein
MFLGLSLLAPVLEVSQLPTSRVITNSLAGPGG